MVLLVADPGLHKYVTPLVPLAVRVFTPPWQKSGKIPSAILTVGMEPTTVTVAVVVLLLLHASVTVRVTWLLPISAQVKLVSDSDRVTLLPEQPSLDPLLTCAAVTVAVPLDRVTVTFCARAVGAVVSPPL